MEYIIIGFVIAVIVAFALFKQPSPTEDILPQTKPSDASIHQSYQLKNIFHKNKPELGFYHALRKTLPANYYLLTKVRMEDVVGVKDTVTANRQGLRSRVKSRHVDFLVIDGDGMPHVAIELDGKSHQLASAKNGDLLKNGVFEACGLPLVRIKPGQDFQVWATRIAQNLPPYVFQSAMAAE